MEKIHTYEQYSDVLAEFKKGRARCSTNRIFMRDELTALIDAGKLFYQEIDGTLWFFSNEGYFYRADFFVPADIPIRLHRQDMAVLTELTGSETRYNVQWEQELIAAGYEKRDKYLGYSSQLDECIDDIKKKSEILHTFFTTRGCTYRKAAKTDLPEIWMLWEDKLGKHRYTLNSIPDAELDEMERHGRCDVICDSEGKIIAASMYLRKKAVAHGLHTATYYEGSGLGAAVLYRSMARAYQEGCKKFAVWVREDNLASTKLIRHIFAPTGKFFRQFVLCPDRK